MCLYVNSHVPMYIGNKKPQLKDLYDYVAVKCASNWKQLGSILSVSEDLLKIIEKDHPQNCEECCSRMLYDWLELTPDATWGILLEAVDKVQSIQDNARGIYVCTLILESVDYPHNNMSYHSLVYFHPIIKIDMDLKISYLQKCLL